LAQPEVDSTHGGACASRLPATTPTVGGSSTLVSLQLQGGPGSAFPQPSPFAAFAAGLPTLNSGRADRVHSHVLTPSVDPCAMSIMPLIADERPARSAGEAGEGSQAALEGQAPSEGASSTLEVARHPVAGAAAAASSSEAAEPAEAAAAPKRRRSLGPKKAPKQQKGGQQEELMSLVASVDEEPSAPTSIAVSAEAEAQLFGPMPGEIAGAAASADTPASGAGEAKLRARSKTGAKRLRCTCKNSKCLKMYCDCFAAGEYCGDCGCVNCANNKENDTDREEARRSVLKRNKHAFDPKVKVSDATLAGTAVHAKGCKCHKSRCQKNYCECYSVRAVQPSRPAHAPLPRVNVSKRARARPRADGCRVHRRVPLQGLRQRQAGRRRRRRPRCGGPGGARPPTHAATRRLLSRAGAPQAPRDLHVMTGADGSMQLTVGGQTVAFDDALGDGAEHDAFAINALNCDELIDVAGGAAVATAAPAARYRGSVVPPAAR
jgi:hypothetical protein